MCFGGKFLEEKNLQGGFFVLRTLKGGGELKNTLKICDFELEIFRTNCQYPQMISPPAGKFCKMVNADQGVSNQHGLREISKTSADFVLFGFDSEKHHLPKFGSEM